LPHDVCLQKRMMIKVTVSGLKSRAIAIVLSLGLCALLTLAASANALIGMLSDQRVNVSKELLAAGIVYAPNSAALNARLAEAEMAEDNRDISAIEGHTRRAVNLAPSDYRLRLLLATVTEANGDRAAAEQSLRDALALAPNYTEVHLRLANLLLREGKLARSVEEFRTAVSSNVTLLPGTLDLLGRVSAGNLTVLRAVTPGDPKSQLVLAQLLLNQSRVSEAMTIFGGIERNALNALPESAAFIDLLISRGRLEEARGLWVGLVSGAYAQPGHPLPLIWNGSFESDISKGLTQFDWTLARNEYAVPSIDSAFAHTGSRSLRIDFAGRDTTRIEGQVKQTLVVRPGVHYRLQCYVKTERLESPEGPRIAVTDMTSSIEITASDPIASGSSEWRPVTIDFTTTPTTRAIIVAIKRIPKFAYDKPTRGAVWFDDFVMDEHVK
jgi:tetratricopeptide (TPR) repeat protein